MEYFFVYGTLMMKYPTNPYKALLTGHCIDYKEATCRGTLFSLIKYPAMVLGNDIVHGEILTIKNPESLFKILDRYEGFYEKNNDNSIYIRQKHVCLSNTSESYSCWTYIYNKPTANLKRLESGKFY
jgi:gamma-glutamylcyclotransferase (GGCT)/AIG2-like uncharacterized protein YtfP